ncbi:E3 ubiquitin-protein ligase TRIM39-like isoform X2 [Podarcis raffonei]|uniref:E3 ubiquitin-protein ligase TRIM39-like isoform X2 n=1 Tax=Podarcis raffonei TaxID=65483 RepID=UPI0023292199|nr:E3 ubiquitin-protein ligase TRIM39-like isoform X2 [Podarcis raffonei]
MATADPAKHLQDEVTCSICLDYFKDPVMITECQHDFCRACITKYWKRSGASICCPDCRRAASWQSLKPNRRLANMVEAAKQLRLQLEQSPGREKMCREHKKPLSLFCTTENTLICMFCERSKAHRNHRVISPERAAADYKKEAEAKRVEIVSEFQQQRQFLEEQEQRQLARLEDIKREIEKRRNDYANTFEDEISYINDLIGDIEKKGTQSPDGFLEGIGSILDRCETEKFQFPATPASADMKERLRKFSQESASLMSSLRRVRDGSESNCSQSNTVKSKWIRENVVLDPETAHPRYIVSSDGKSVRWGDVRQDYPYNPKRFEYARCVLGTQGFSSGKHYWTVDVEDIDHWAVGVASESVERDREIDFEPDEGIWAMGFSYDQYKALTSPPTVLEPEEDPVEIQVSLNYEAGTVAFYDAEDKTRLFIFQSIDFEGEEVFPFFRIGNSSAPLQLCS